MIKAVVIALIVVVPGLGNAQSVVCAGKIINEGVTKAEVAAACGAPTQVGRDAHDPAIGAANAPDSDEGTEVWTYNFGPRKLMQRIWFDDGRVKLVESLGFGH